MIEIEHNRTEILGLFKSGEQIVLPKVSKRSTLITQFYAVAELYANETLVWYHKDFKNNIDRTYIKNNFKPYMMWSYGSVSFLGAAIGYIEDSPYLKVNYKVKYPTWLMTSSCGVIASSQFIKFKGTVSDTSIDFALNSIAKLGMPLGLWCYSVPGILLSKVSIASEKADIYNVFKFTALHYKKSWIYLLFLNLLLYQGRFTIIPMFYALMINRRNCHALEIIDPQDVKNNKMDATLDVIIPTIGRKIYLYDFLQDLKSQSHLPKTVIIIEQNPDENSSSDLDYLVTETWPFQIKHIFTHTTGACNARNLAFDHVTSNFIFLADDDIRIEDHRLIEKTLCLFGKRDTNIVNFACLQIGEVEKVSAVRQWSAFGSGCTIFLAELAEQTKFNLAFEKGYGEDVDYGMQLRNRGEDIIYASHLKLVHLKAPIGGFRSNLTVSNPKENLTPKPSATVMLFRMLYTTKYQLLGYKLVLCIKYYKLQNLKNPFSYLSLFKKQWKLSVIQALVLKQTLNA
jgi:GT2 family glycosyltransferase